MAQEKPDPVNYYISIAGAGGFYALRINDVTVWRDFDAVDRNLTVPVNAWLQEGRNDISVTFVSVAGEPFQYNVANPDYYFLSELERLDPTTRDKQRVTLLNLALDDLNRVSQPETTRFDLPVERRSSPPMQIAGGGQDQAGLASGWGDDWTGRRVTTAFRIADPLPAGPWTSAAVVPDTPEMRGKLLDAYRKLHATLQSGDRDRIAAAYAPAWTHLAQAMGYASVQEYIQKVRPFEELQPRDAQGKVLQPLDLVMGQTAFQVERMAGGRLVRIVPDPIIWTSDADPENVKSTNVAFFLGGDGAFHVGAVLY